ncbi:MAG: hypothetical protein U5K69_26955 [Balneolaceae bacterium]|nr:hypothetical protein [Balneolaceae bacterium]
MNALKLLEHSDEDLAQRSDMLSSFIGETPLFPISNINPYDNVKVFAKLEWQQFGSSVKGPTGIPYHA